MLWRKSLAEDKDAQSARAFGLRRLCQWILSKEGLGGKEMVTRRPFCAFSAQAAPWCCSAMARTMFSPTPAPGSSALPGE